MAKRCFSGGRDGFEVCAVASGRWDGRRTKAPWRAEVQIVSPSDAVDFTVGAQEYRSAAAALRVASRTAKSVAGDVRRAAARGASDAGLMRVQERRFGGRG
jgi:hypothetical protein